MKITKTRANTRYSYECTLSLVSGRRSQDSRWPMSSKGKKKKKTFDEIKSSARSLKRWKKGHLRSTSRSLKVTQRSLKVFEGPIHDGEKAMAAEVKHRKEEKDDEKKGKKGEEDPNTNWRRFRKKTPLGTGQGGKKK